MSWYQVKTPHFTAGFRVTDGVIDRAAPTIGWLIGKSLLQITVWAKDHHGDVAGPLDDEPDIE